jgi:hypothetical protein
MKLDFLERLGEVCPSSSLHFSESVLLLEAQVELFTKLEEFELVDRHFFEKFHSSSFVIPHGKGLFLDLSSEASSRSKILVRLFVGLFDRFHVLLLTRAHLFQQALGCFVEAE